MALLRFAADPAPGGHEITVEGCAARADGSPQFRWTCSCGEVGIPVGAPCYEGREWAGLAGWYHAGTSRANE